MKYAKWYFAAVGAIVLVAVTLSLIGLGMGWFNAGGKVISADNVKKQHTVVIGQYQDMIGAAENACSAQQAAAGTKTDKDALVLESPIAAREATFRSLVSKYSATVDNPFEGQVVVPDGYPTSAELSGLDTSDWCTVGEQLKALRG